MWDVTSSVIGKVWLPLSSQLSATAAATVAITEADTSANRWVDFVEDGWSSQIRVQSRWGGLGSFAMNASQIFLLLPSERRRAMRSCVPVRRDPDKS